MCKVSVYYLETKILKIIKSEIKVKSVFLYGLMKLNHIRVTKHILLVFYILPEKGKCLKNQKHHTEAKTELPGSVRAI